MRPIAGMLVGVACVISLGSTAFSRAVGTPLANSKPTEQKHILFLAVDDLTQPYLRLITESFSRVILSDSSSPVLYFETLDALRFQKPDYLAGLRDWFRQKYANTHIDLIVAIGEDAPAFIASAPQPIWSDAQVLYWDIGWIREDIQARLPHAAGILLEDHFSAAVGAIKRILPDTERVALVYGASAVEAGRFAGYSDKIRDTGLNLEPVVVAGTPERSLVSELNALPEHTAVILLQPSVDVHNRIVSPGQLCQTLSPVMVRPLFTLGIQDLGCGVVGGLLRDWTKVGQFIARRALALLVTPAQDVVTVPIADYTTPAFDERQLARWHIDEANLPAGSLVQFRRPSLWRDHRTGVLTAAGVGAAQMIVIAALLVEHRRRRLAEVESRRHLVAMAHLDRRAAMGELATSLAHEINQPLNAILQNAGAARMMLDADTPADSAEVREILDDIRNDDLRASEVIRRMRVLLQKHELERHPVDLEHLAGDTLMLVRPDAQARGIEVELDLEGDLPVVMGDRVHLQQVLLNLLLNGMDATTRTPRDRRIAIFDVRKNGHAGLGVRDSGPGIAPEHLARIFEPFFTTKGEGMGMGLAIARSITEAHGGRIAAENSRDGGATVWFTVPIVRT